MADVKILPRFDISNEAWREYLYKDHVLRVEKPRELILEKRDGGDRHRLIVAVDEPGGGLVGMYITPGWYAIRWQGHDGSHAIEF